MAVVSKIVAIVHVASKYDANLCEPYRLSNTLQCKYVYKLSNKQCKVWGSNDMCIQAFWVVILCGLINFYPHISYEPFPLAQTWFYFHAASSEPSLQAAYTAYPTTSVTHFNPEYGGNMVLQNAGKQ
jgi:hypothetical protein